VRPDLTSVKIATLVAQGFPEEQIRAGQEFLRAVGATVTTVSETSAHLPDAGTTVAVQLADETGFDALLLPGGQASADNLCNQAAAVEFVRSFLTAAKPVGAIADGVKVLIGAKAIAGRRVTGGSALKDTIRKAGGVWIEKAVAADRLLVTTAEPASLESFFGAFAQSCMDYKMSSGGSLHTD
jgi:protease I